LIEILLTPHAKAAKDAKGAELNNGAANDSPVFFASFAPLACGTREELSITTA